MTAIPPPPPRSAPAPRPSDAELVDRAKQGDKEAFGLIVRRHQARLHRLVSHIVRSAPVAEELTQEVFVRAYRALGQFDGRAEPFTWLYRIALNLALNERRRARHHYEVAPRSGDLAAFVEQLTKLSGEPHDDPADRALRGELYRTLVEGLDALSELLRTTLLLVAIEGLTHDEAGEVLGIPPGTVAWRVHEARRKLSEFFEDRGLGRPRSSSGGQP